MPKSELAPKSYFVVAPAKLAIMSVCTFGLYNVYWMYKQWKAVFAEDTSRRGHAFWRALFGGIWCFSLFKSMGIDRPYMAGAQYFVYSAFWRFPGVASLLGFSNVLPFVRAQIQVNKRMSVSPELKFSGKAKATCVAGSLLLVLAIIGLALPSK
jgi:hypothetical protein